VSNNEIEKDLEKAIAAVRDARQMETEETLRRNKLLKEKESKALEPIVTRIDDLIFALKNKIAKVEFEVKQNQVKIVLDSERFKYSNCTIEVKVSACLDGSCTISVRRKTDKLVSIGTGKKDFESADEAWGEMLRICAEYADIRPI